jgi:hypothetical protein
MTELIRGNPGVRNHAPWGKQMPDEAGVGIPGFGSWVSIPSVGKSVNIDESETGIS